MKKSHLIMIKLLFLFLLVSCEGNDDPINNPNTEKKIPIDSLYFSCKIDGQTMVFKSPGITSSSGGHSFQRLFKLKNSPKDSIVVGYRQEFHNDSISVAIGFSKSLLIDTTEVFFQGKENHKDQILTTGEYMFRYAPAFTGLKEITAEHEGFSISIWNYKKRIEYASFRDYFRMDCSRTKYEEFKKNASCQITKAQALNSGIYSDYRNAWFIEATFNCRLYRVGSESDNALSLTEGRFSGVF